MKHNPHLSEKENYIFHLILERFKKYNRKGFLSKEQAKFEFERLGFVVYEIDSVLSIVADTYSPFFYFLLKHRLKEDTNFIIYYLVPENVNFK